MTSFFHALRRFVLAAPILLLAAACAPIVTHGPRVEPGPTVGFTAGLPYLVCDSCDVDPITLWSVYARYGWMGSDSTGPRLLLGASLPYFDPEAAEVDGYVQLPSSPSRSYGVGALVSSRHVMPYVQYGRIGPTGSGWYTTQGAAFHSFEGDWLDFETAPGGTEVAPRYWSPTVAFRRDVGGVALHVYATGALGDFRRRVLDPETEEWRDDGRHPLRALSFGMSLEANLGGALRPQ